MSGTTPTTGPPLDRPADVLVVGGHDSAGEAISLGVWGDRAWRLPADSGVDAAIRIDAAGHIVVPGLVDLHVHIYREVTPWGIDIDPVAARSGVTTVVDAGSAGASTFAGFAAQLRALRSVTGRALVNLSRIGLIGEFDELAHPELIDVDAAAATV
ncbi:MAG: amidohydrolase/deacetylase family metallohydrolase, partial [Actinobacteria bacterium]|nr:amidohydrolase/deacetylase family metallohydrolase [Actinomycetota bacterium]